MSLSPLSSSSTGAAPARAAGPQWSPTAPLDAPIPRSSLGARQFPRGRVCALLASQCCPPNQAARGPPIMAVNNGRRLRTPRSAPDPLYSLKAPSPRRSDRPLPLWSPAAARVARRRSPLPLVARRGLPLGACRQLGCLPPPRVARRRCWSSAAAAGCLPPPLVAYRRCWSLAAAAGRSPPPLVACRCRRWSLATFLWSLVAGRLSLVAGRSPPFSGRSPPPPFSGRRCLSLAAGLAAALLR